jgi:hypothetical protein
LLNRPLLLKSTEDGARPPCFQNMHAVRHVKSTNTWQKGHRETKKSEITRPRQSALTHLVEKLFPSKSIAPAFGSCNRNTGRWSNAFGVRPPSMVDTGRHSRPRKQSNLPPRNQASSSPSRPIQAQVHPRKLKACVRGGRSEQISSRQTAARKRKTKGRNHPWSIPNLARVAPRQHSKPGDGTPEISQQQAQRKSKRRKANCALGGLRLRRASGVSADPAATCFSSLFRRDENATRRTRDQGGTVQPWQQQAEERPGSVGRAHTTCLVSGCQTKPCFRSQPACRARSGATSRASATTEHRARRSAVAATRAQGKLRGYTARSTWYHPLWICFLALETSERPPGARADGSGTGIDLRLSHWSGWRWMLLCSFLVQAPKVKLHLCVSVSSRGSCLHINGCLLRSTASSLALQGFVVTAASRGRKRPDDELNICRIL